MHLLTAFRLYWQLFLSFTAFRFYWFKSGEQILVQAAVLLGFGDMLGLDLRGILQIADGLMRSIRAGAVVVK